MASTSELKILLTADDKASGKLNKLKGNMAGWGKAAAGMGAVGVSAVLGIATASTKMAAEFEGRMREVNTMLGLNEEQFQNLQNQVLDLSKEVGISGDELAGALYQAVSAGVPASEMMDLLRVSAQAAVGGVTDTETAMDGLTTILNAFKISAKDSDKIADKMFATVKGGKTTWDELASSMYNVAPMASTIGAELDEVLASIATMTKQGVPTAQATTQIRAAMQALIKPTAEMKKVFTDLGYATAEDLIQAKGFGGALDILTEAAGGNKEMLGKMFGSVEGLQAVFALTGENAKTFEKDLTSVTDSAGASMEAFNEVNKGAGRQFEIMINKGKTLMATLGLKLLPVLTPLIDGFTELIEALPMDEIGDLISDLLPPLIRMMTNLLKALPVEGIIKLVNVALKPLITVLEILMTVITPVIQALSWLINKIAEFARMATEWLFGPLGQISGYIKGFFGGFPTFQYGGTIPGPAGQPRMIMAHAGETVVPHHGGGAGLTIINNIAGSVITQRELESIIRESFLRIKSRNVTTGF